jgi:hypothetical protein
MWTLFSFLKYVFPEAQLQLLWGSNAREEAGQSSSSAARDGILHHCAQVRGVRSLKRAQTADDYKTVHRTRKCDVQAPRIGKEADSTLAIRPNTAAKHYRRLRTLKRVHRVHDKLGHRRGSSRCTNTLLLRGVKGYDDKMRCEIDLQFVAQVQREADDCGGLDGILYAFGLQHMLVRVCNVHKRIRRPLASRERRFSVVDSL